MLVLPALRENRPCITVKHSYNKSTVHFQYNNTCTRVVNENVHGRETDQTKKKIQTRTNEINGQDIRVCVFEEETESENTHKEKERESKREYATYTLVELVSDHMNAAYFYDYRTRLCTTD